MYSYALLLPYFKRHLARLFLGLAALFSVDILQLVIPRLVKQAVDTLTFFTATPGSLARDAGLILAIAGMIALLRLLWRPLIFGFSRIVERELRARLQAHLLTLDPYWFKGRPPGELMALATNDIEAVRIATGMGLVALLDSTVLGLAAVGFMAWINPLLTALAMFFMPLIALITLLTGRLIHARFENSQEIFARITEKVREAFNAIRLIKAHNLEAQVIRDLEKHGQEFMNQNMGLALVAGPLMPLMSLFTGLSVVMVIFFGGRFTIFGAVSPGDLVAFIAYLGIITWPMMALGWVVNILQRGAASLDRLDYVFRQKPSLTSPDATRRIEEPRGEVWMRGVCFAYPGAKAPALDIEELVIPAGLTTAIIGRTGAGKTTLAELIPRLLLPLKGLITLDGAPIEELNLEDLRSLIAYVPQDGFIFSGSVAENIAFGRPGLHRDQIEELARAANLYEEMMELPRGLDSLLGERGLTLSGGQRQRLALARALAVNAPLMILDDPFSAVDAATEKTILANLKRLRQGLTTLVISHRLTSLAHADLIHVLENGRVSESGGHEALMAADGYYARLFALQNLEGQLEPEAPSVR